MTRAQRLRKKTFKRLIRSAEPALLAKLERNEQRYKFGNTWLTTQWEASLQRQLPEHVAKGDPTDVVIYGLMAMYHGWRTAPAKTPEI